MTWVCGHEARDHVQGAELIVGTACMAPGAFRSFGDDSVCGCAGYTEQWRCDFCSAIPAPWSYPTATTVAMIGGHTVGSSPVWMACEACSTLIEAGDRRGVAQRILATVGGENDEDAIAFVLNAQSIQFWSVRRGPRERDAETAPS